MELASSASATRGCRRTGSADADAPQRPVARLHGGRETPGPEDAEVVQDVNHDSGPQPEGERQVEQDEADVPRVDHAEQPLVFMPLPESDVRGHDGGREQPAVLSPQLGVEQAEARPVREGDPDADVEPLDEAEGDDVEELEAHHRTEQHQPPVDDLLANASQNAEPRPLHEDEAGLVRPRLPLDGEFDAAEQREPHAPGEDHPRRLDDVGERPLHRPHPEEAQRSVDPVVEEDVEDADDDEDADHLAQNTGGSFTDALLEGGSYLLAHLSLLTMMFGRSPLPAEVAGVRHHRKYCKGAIEKRL